MKAGISNIGIVFVSSILIFSSLTFAQGFDNIVGNLKEIGVFEFYLPFLIVFGVLYGLLNKAGIFGAEKRITVIISLAAAGFILVYTPVGITFGQFLANFFGQTVVVILTVAVILIFVTMLQTGGIIPATKDKDGKQIPLVGSVGGILALLAILAVGVFVSSGGTSLFPGLTINTRELFPTGISSNAWAMIILIVGTGLAVYFFGKSEKTQPPRNP